MLVLQLGDGLSLVPGVAILLTIEATVRGTTGLTGLGMSYRNALQLFPITINLIRIMDRKCPSVANAVWHQLTEILW